MTQLRVRIASKMVERKKVIGSFGCAGSVGSHGGVEVPHNHCPDGFAHYHCPAKKQIGRSEEKWRRSDACARTASPGRLCYPHQRGVGSRVAHLQLHTGIVLLQAVQNVGRSHLRTIGGTSISVMFLHVQILDDCQEKTVRL